MGTACLCHPMNTMLLQYGDLEDLTSIADSLGFGVKDYIFIPVNNASFGEFSPKWDSLGTACRRPQRKALFDVRLDG